MTNPEPLPKLSHLQDRSKPNPQSAIGFWTPKLIKDYKTLVQSGLSAEQAADSLSINWARWKRYCSKYAKEAKTELQLELMQSLRQHVRDNATAAIFAAKAKLGWQDRQESQQIQAVEYIDLPSSESRDAWLKRQQAKAGK